MEPCPSCGRPVGVGNLDLHLLRCMGAAPSAAPSATVPAPAPAAAPAPPLPPPPYRDTPPPHHSTVSVADLRAMCAVYGIDTRHFVEKMEFLAALAAAERVVPEPEVPRAHDQAAQDQMARDAAFARDIAMEDVPRPPREAGVGDGGDQDPMDQRDIEEALRRSLYGARQRRPPAAAGAAAAAAAGSGQDHLLSDEALARAIEREDYPQRPQPAAAGGGAFDGGTAAILGALLGGGMALNAASNRAAGVGEHISGAFGGALNGAAIGGLAALLAGPFLNGGGGGGGGRDQAGWRNMLGAMSETELTAIINRLGAEHVPRQEAAASNDISDLPTAQASEADCRGDNASCVICMEDYVPGDGIKSLPCLHRFHTGCVDTWLRQCGTCPMCKVRVGGEGMEEGDG